MAAERPPAYGSSFSILRSQFSIPSGPRVALRRFRLPVAARVTIKDGRPVRVTTERRGLEGGMVESAAGPWRTSGEWWRVPDARVEVTPGIDGGDLSDHAAAGPLVAERTRARLAAAPPEFLEERRRIAVGWNRDEWDVALSDGGVYRIYRDRSRDRWFVDGILD